LKLKVTHKWVNCLSGIHHSNGKNNPKNQLTDCNKISHTRFCDHGHQTNMRTKHLYKSVVSDRKYRVAQTKYANNTECSRFHAFNFDFNHIHKFHLYPCVKRQ